LVRRPVGATLSTDYRQIWQGGGGRQYLLTAKVKNFRGSFGEFRPRKPENCVITQKMPENNFIFAPCRRMPWSKIMKLTMLMLLYGLHLCFNFGKIRFINDGFITKRILVLKNLDKCFWPVAQKLGIGSKNNCMWQILYWRPLSACTVWWRSINVRQQKNEKRKRFFVCMFVTL